MTVDINPLEMNSAFVEPIFMSINAVGFDENAKEKMKEDMELDAFENMEKLKYPKVREDLLDFLLKQRDANANVAICRRCSAVFDKNAARTFEEQKKVEVEKEKEKVRQARKEVEKKLAEREAKVARLRKNIAGKHKIVIVTSPISV